MDEDDDAEPATEEDSAPEAEVAEDLDD